MSDLIKREDAIEAITYSNLNALTKKERVLLIQALPSADRPKGKWIDTGKENIYGGKCIKCSVCEHEVIVTHIEDEWYCRHCGADMRGADDEMR